MWVACGARLAMGGYTWCRNARHHSGGSMLTIPRLPAVYRYPLSASTAPQCSRGEAGTVVVAAIRRNFHLDKVGHAGTLDPNATGLLIILLGKGTKLSERLMSSDKVYEGTAKFADPFAN